MEVLTDLLSCSSAAQQDLLNSSSKGVPPTRLMCLTVVLKGQLSCLLEARQDPWNSCSQGVRQVCCQTALSNQLIGLLERCRPLSMKAMQQDKAIRENPGKKCLGSKVSETP